LPVPARIVFEERSFSSIDNKKSSVGHVNRPFNLAAEIGMTRRVDNINFLLLYMTAVFLAKIVMPFSRSKSLLSRMVVLGHLSLIFAERMVCLSIPSTRVVFPCQHGQQ